MSGVVHHEHPDRLMAWRYWQLTPDRVHLRSVSQRAFVWKPGEPLGARCVGERHPAPSPGCSCGIYGASTLAALREHGVCLTPAPLVVGEVGLWGAVVDDGDAYRAEYGYPERLSVVTESLGPGGTEGEGAADVVASLSAYGVSVGTTSMEHALGEISSTIMRFLSMSGPSEPAGRRRH